MLGCGMGTDLTICVDSERPGAPSTTLESSTPSRRQQASRQNTTKAQRAWRRGSWLCSPGFDDSPRSVHIIRVQVVTCLRRAAHTRAPSWARPPSTRAAVRPQSDSPASRTAREPIDGMPKFSSSQLTPTLRVRKWRRGELLPSQSLPLLGKRRRL
jgi:hypothetical protein